MNTTTDRKRTHRNASRSCSGLLALAGVAVLVTTGLTPSAAASPETGARHAAELVTSAATVSARYVPITPVRVVDTRQARGASTLAPGGDTQVLLVTPQIRAAVGAGEITAVVVNLTATATAKAGFVTLWGSGSQPDASSLNAVRANQTVANLVTTPVATDGTARIYSDAGGDFLIDVQGVYIAASSATAGRIVALGEPLRVVDTRPNNPLIGDTSRQVDVTAAGVPVDASAVVVNITATDASAAGFLTVWPAGAPRPESSNLNIESGASTAVANQVFTALNAGRFEVFTTVTTNMIVDVAGYFTGTSAPDSGDGLFVAVAPTRVLDTRSATGPTAGQRLPADQALAVAVAGRGGLPTSGIAAVALNTTVTGTTGPGWAVNYPAGTTRPPTSSVNATAADHTVANHVTSGVTTDGVSIYADIDTHALIDLTGYFTGTTAVAPAPTPAPDLSQPPTRGSHAFLFNSPVGPARWDPCRPIRYLVNAEYATPNQRQRMNEALASASANTGLSFAYAGETTVGHNLFGSIETIPAGVDALLIFGRPGITSGLTSPAVAGLGGGSFTWNQHNAWVLSGAAMVNVDNTGDGQLHRAVWLHELGHMLGLEHVTDRAELMYPTAGSVFSYQNGDREGLWHLGATKGCILRALSGRDAGPGDDIDTVWRTDVTDEFMNHDHHVDDHHD